VTIPGPTLLDPALRIRLGLVVETYRRSDDHTRRVTRYQDGAPRYPPRSGYVPRVLCGPSVVYSGRVSVHSALVLEPPMTPRGETLVVPVVRMVKT
jgi:hypothetical protein